MIEFSARYPVAVVASLAACIGAASGTSGYAAPPLPTTPNSVGMTLVRIPPGDFDMGSSDTDEDLRAAFPELVALELDDEHPVHRVRITQPFWIAAHETTLGQYREFCRDTGHVPESLRDGRGGKGWTGNGWSYGRGYDHESWGHVGQTANHPVVNVTWNDAVAFCQWLSRRERAEYRLPTEAEWEYCCRAGSTARFPSGDDVGSLTRLGNVADRQSRNKWPDPADVVLGLGGGNITKIPFPFHPSDDGYALTAPVGRFEANAWGLHDMVGNVSEWCADRYEADWYAKSPTRNPQGPADGSRERRVCRGSGHSNPPADSRCSHRCWDAPTACDCGTGFRVVRTAW